jgi:dsDNA-specific endonuclease/ATPase MutS2
MVPSVDYAYIQARLDETSEARRLLSSRGTVPFGGITDIRGVL